MVRVTEGVAKIPRYGAVQESIIGTLAVGLKVGRGSRIIKSAQQAAELATAAAIGVTASIPEESDRGDTRGWPRWEKSWTTPETASVP